jgi:hypothetical protein
MATKRVMVTMTRVAGSKRLRVRVARAMAMVTKG